MHRFTYRGPYDSIDDRKRETLIDADSAEEARAKFDRIERNAGSITYHGEIHRCDGCGGWKQTERVEISIPPCAGDAGYASVADLCFSCREGD